MTRIRLLSLYRRSGPDDARDVRVHVGRMLQSNGQRLKLVAALALRAGELGSLPTIDCEPPDLANGLVVVLASSAPGVGNQHRLGGVAAITTRTLLRGRLCDGRIRGALSIATASGDYVLTYEAQLGAMSRTSASSATESLASPTHWPSRVAPARPLAPCAHSGCL